MTEERRQVIIFAGLPLTGKTTLAKRVSERLGVRHLDIDENIRFPIFGYPDPDPYRSSETREQSRFQSGWCYDLLFHALDAHLAMGYSVIMTATFSRKLYRENLLKIIAKHPNVLLKIVWCTARREDTEVEEVVRRLNSRGKDHPGGCISVEHYLDDKRRYVPMDLPHLELDTFPPHTIEECTEKALQYILS